MPAADATLETVAYGSIGRDPVATTMRIFGQILAGILPVASVAAIILLRDSTMQAPATAVLVGAAVICYELMGRQSA